MAMYSITYFPPLMHCGSCIQYFFTKKAALAMVDFYMDRGTKAWLN